MDIPRTNLTKESTKHKFGEYFAESEVFLIPYNIRYITGA